MNEKAEKQYVEVEALLKWVSENKMDVEVSETDEAGIFFIEEYVNPESLISYIKAAKVSVK